MMDIRIQYDDEKGLNLPRMDDLLECKCGQVWEADRALGDPWEECQCPECGEVGAELFEPPVQPRVIAIKGGRYDHFQN